MGQLARERKAQSCTFYALLQTAFNLRKFLKDDALIALGDADAGVRHRELDLVIVLASAHTDFTARRELDGIGDKVAENLGDLLLIGEQWRKIISRLKDQIEESCQPEAA